MGHYPYGIKNMLKTSNLKQVGNIHNGFGKFYFKYILITYIIILIFFFSDDCVNIINIMNVLAQKGCEFKATNQLIV